MKFSITKKGPSNGIFVSEIYSLVPEIFKFLFNQTDDVTNRFSTKVNHKIKNVLGGTCIRAVLLKLGTDIYLPTLSESNV